MLIVGKQRQYDANRWNCHDKGLPTCCVGFVAAFASISASFLTISIGEVVVGVSGANRAFGVVVVFGIPGETGIDDGSKHKYRT